MQILGRIYFAIDRGLYFLPPPPPPARVSPSTLAKWMNDGLSVCQWVREPELELDWRMAVLLFNFAQWIIAKLAWMNRKWVNKAFVWHFVGDGSMVKMSLTLGLCVETWVCSMTAIYAAGQSNQPQVSVVSGTWDLLSIWRNVFPTNCQRMRRINGNSAIFLRRQNVTPCGLLSECFIFAYNVVKADNNRWEEGRGEMLKKLLQGVMLSLETTKSHILCISSTYCHRTMSPVNIVLI